MLFALAALVQLFLFKVHIPFVDMVCQILICGGALYYVFHTFQKRRSVTLLMLLMAIIGLLYNPIIPVHLAKVIWLVIHIVTMLLFYIISLKTPIDDSIITRKDSEEESRQS